MDYTQALNWIHGIQRFGMNPGLERIEVLLDSLGNPHKRLRFLHIGGSNGKGSAAAFAARIMETAGYRVGLYTSPYLVEFTNRMAINGTDISQERLVEMVERIKPLVEDVAADPALGQPTEFEVVTAMALTYFAEEAPDLVVLEVGLGGRLDATNVVDPLAAVLTTVSLEHTQVLGQTLEEVAREKAGIVKKNGTVITGAAGEALEVIRKRCREKGAKLFCLGQDFGVEKVSSRLEGQVFHYSGLRHTLQDLRLTMLGDYQPGNAALALAALEVLEEKGFTVPEKAVRYGLEHTRWPGRLEIMRRAPLVVLDGAHNLEAFKGLKRSLEATFSYRYMVLVLGLLDDKPIDDILREIAPLAQVLIVTTPNSPRAYDPWLLQDKAAGMVSGPVHVVEDIPGAVNLALSLARAPDLVLIAGSLYLVSDARRLLAGGRTALLQ